MPASSRPPVGRGRGGCAEGHRGTGARRTPSRQGTADGDPSTVGGFLPCGSGQLQAAATFQLVSSVHRVLESKAFVPPSDAM